MADICSDLLGLLGQFPVYVIQIHQGILRKATLKELFFGLIAAKVFVYDLFGKFDLNLPISEYMKMWKLFLVLTNNRMRCKPEY